MRLLGLRAAERAVWDIYKKRAESSDNSLLTMRLGSDSEWLFLVWWYNTLSDEYKIDIPANCHRSNNWGGPIDEDV